MTMEYAQWRGLCGHTWTVANLDWSKRKPPECPDCASTGTRAEDEALALMRADGFGRSGLIADQPIAAQDHAAIEAALGRFPVSEAEPESHLITDAKCVWHPSSPLGGIPVTAEMERAGRETLLSWGKTVADMYRAMAAAAPEAESIVVTEEMLWAGYQADAGMETKEDFMALCSGWCKGMTTIYRAMAAASQESSYETIQVAEPMGALIADRDKAWRERDAALARAEAAEKERDEYHGPSVEKTDFCGMHAMSPRETQ